MSRTGCSLLMRVIRVALFLAATSGQVHAAEQGGPPVVSRAVEVPPPAGWTPGSPLFDLEGDGPTGGRPQARESSPVAASVRRVGRSGAQPRSLARQPSVTLQGWARGKASPPTRPLKGGMDGRARSSVAKVVRKHAPQVAHKPARKPVATGPAPTTGRAVRKAPRHAAPQASSSKQPVRAKAAQAASPSRASRPPPDQLRAKAPTSKRERPRVGGAGPDAAVAKKAARAPRSRAPSNGAEQGAQRTVLRSG